MALWHDQKASSKGRNMELLQQGARVLQEPPFGEDVRILNPQKTSFVELLPSIVSSFLHYTVSRLLF